MTDPKKLREYLLGKMTDETELEQFEMRLLSEDELLESLLVEEDELIDDLVDGTLAADERRAFETTFALTNERRQKIELAKAVRRKFGAARPLTDVEHEPGLWDRIRSILIMKRLGTATAFGILLVGFLLAGWIFFVRPSDESAFSAALNRAFQNERPINARITDLDYAPFSERRGPKSIVSDENALRRAENMSRDAVYENETAENLHDLGKLQIAKREFAEAKKTLEKALAKKPDDPTILNELGIAEIIAADNAASGGEHLRLVATALEHFDKAVRLSPKFAEAWFNRALAIGKLNVPSEEAAAWRDYLNIDSTSKWADEARSRLTQLESQTVVPITAAELVEEFLAAYRQRDDETAFRRLSENKEMITGKLVFQQLAFLFTDAEPASDRSKELLAAMQYAADLELKKTGDKFWKHLADYYAQNGAAKRSQLKTAQDEVRAAYTDTLNNQYESAKPRFETAKKIFDNTGNDGESMIMDYWIAYLDQMASQIDSSRSRLLKTSALAEKRGFSWLNSQYLSWLGHLAYFEDDLTICLDYDRQAYAIAEKNSDHFQRKRLLDSMGGTHHALGSQQHSMELVADSLSINNPRYTSYRQHWRSLFTASDLLTARHYYSAARVLLKESLWINGSYFKETSFQYRALIVLGQIEFVTEDHMRSLDHFEEARETLTFFDESTRTRYAAVLDTAVGHVLRDMAKCEEALPLYERAAVFHEASEAQIEHFDTRRGMLLCHIAINNTQGISENTDIVLDQIDRYRNIIRSESYSNGFFGNVQTVYDSLIDYEISLGNSLKALEYAEASRSRSLLDMMSQPILIDENGSVADIKLPKEFSRPLSIQSIRKELGNDTQLLVYSVLLDKVVAWVVSEESINAVSTIVSRKEFDQTVREFVSTISSPGSFSHSDHISDNYLATTLVNPVRLFLDPAKTIVVIPDKSLSKLPFGALPYGGKRFLAQEFIFQYAPSGSVFALATEMARSTAGSSDERILVVGDPAFDRAAYPGYSRLSGGAREAAEIGKIVSDGIVLTGTEATPGNIIRSLAEVNVFHFAGHYIYSSTSPLDSGMLLAGKGADSMMRNTVLRKHFVHLNLAVLSACTTGSEQINDSEGMLGAARIFLANGIPQVVASHWEVDSETSADLMTDFYKNRKSNGLSTTRALRDAQLSMIDSSDPRRRDPYYWAPFFAYGAAVTNPRYGGNL